MLRCKTRNHKLKKIFSVGLVTLFILATAMVGCSFGKSLYVLADTNDNATPIQAYDIQGDKIVYQSTVDTGFGWGSVGLAIDTDSKTLFMTQENSGTIRKIDAQTFADLGQVVAPGASDLAGIVVDQGKGLVYAVDRDWSQNPTNLYVYDLDFNLQDTIPLPHGAVGIALDETNGLLYVTNFSPTVYYYDTATWTEQGNFNVSHTSGWYGAVGIAVDAVNGYVYTGAWTSDDLISQYDLNTATETTLNIGTGVVGLAVDPATGLLYITTCGTGDDIRVYNTSTSPFTLTDQTGDIGNPAGICIPGKDISYNPLDFAKDDGLEYPEECAAPGGNITYTLSYDNLANSFAVHNITITDPLPAEVTFVSATGSYTYEASTRTVTWDIGTLPASDSGGSVQLVVEVTPSVTAGITITNSATIDSEDTPPTTQNEETCISTCVPPTPDDIIVYPNPCYYPIHDKVCIANLPVGAKVYIYTVSGELIRTLDATTDGCRATAIWDLKNEAGEMVSRGIYVLYIPEANGKILKVAIAK